MKKSVCASRSASAIVRKIKERSKGGIGKSARNSNRVKNAENRVAIVIVKNRIEIKTVEKIEKEIGGRENASGSQVANGNQVANEFEERTGRRNAKKNANGGLEVVNVNGRLVEREKGSEILVGREKGNVSLAVRLKESENLAVMVKGSGNLAEMVNGNASLVERIGNLVGIEIRSGRENLVGR